MKNAKILEAGIKQVRLVGGKGEQVPELPKNQHDC